MIANHEKPASNYGRSMMGAILSSFSARTTQFHPERATLEQINSLWNALFVPDDHFMKLSTFQPFFHSKNEAKKAGNNSVMVNSL